MPPAPARHQYAQALDAEVHGRFPFEALPGSLHWSVMTNSAPSFMPEGQREVTVFGLGVEAHAIGPVLVEVAEARPSSRRRCSRRVAPDRHVDADHATLTLAAKSRAASPSRVEDGDAVAVSWSLASLRPSS